MVKAVDLHTGNMTLDANLVVKGDITEGMIVRCQGNITVGGVIESADVWAKGNIIIGNGVLGRSHNHDEYDHGYSVSVKAGRNIRARYASYAKLYAQGDINIAEHLLHCDSTAKGCIVVGNEKASGSQVVGGITRSSVTIITDILGAEAGVFTQCELRGALDIKYYEVACNNSILEAQKKMLQNVRSAYNKFMTVELTETRQKLVDKINNTINSIEKEIIASKERDQLLKDECEQMIQGLSIVVKKKIQPNVLVIAGSAQFKTSRERAAAELFYRKGEILYIPALNH